MHGEMQVMQSSIHSGAGGHGGGHSIVCNSPLPSLSTHLHAVCIPKYKGIRYRPELGRYISEIRPAQPRKRKIWLGTYKTAEEAARAFDAGIFYTKKPINYNFEDSPSILEPLPENLTPEEEHVEIQKKAKAAAARVQATQVMLETKPPRNYVSDMTERFHESQMYCAKPHEPPREIQFAVVLDR
uniref:AP2/ERF domain-containing protein n=2 Tax=Physcomitrium patens TaxID=3218 RepID=A0A7I4EVR8_PHYPA